MLFFCKDMLSLKMQTLAQGLKTTVPSDYAFSFDIIPTGLVSVWSSIMHYTQDYSNIGPKGRIPGMKLTKLKVPLLIVLSIALFFNRNSNCILIYISTTKCAYINNHHYL